MEMVGEKEKGGETKKIMCDKYSSCSLRIVGGYLSKICEGFFVILHPFND